MRRLFWAALIGRPAASVLRAARADLAAVGADVKWVRDDHFHMTLSFLGNQEESRISAALRAGERAAQFFPMPRLRFNSLGAFPDWKRPRVLWAGLDMGGEALKMLAADLAKNLREEGFALEARPFAPHATLGRVRSAKRRRELADRAQRWRIGGPWEDAVAAVPSITLFESRLTPSGPAYLPLAETRLAG